VALHPDYVSAADLADFVRALPGDAYVASLATAASRAVDGACHRQFGQAAALMDLEYDAGDAAQLRNGRWWLSIHDVQDVTGLTVTVDGTLVSGGATGYKMWPADAAYQGVPYTGITFADRPYGDVVLNAKPGWSAVPAAAIVATRLQGSRWHVRRESPYGTAGTEESTTSLTSRLDPDVRGALASAGLIRAEYPA
jgi:hypothetical protein